MASSSPKVLLLDGDFDNTLSVARELSEDLDATIVGVGTSPYSRLHRSKHCDEAVVAPPADHEAYADVLLEVIDRRHPDMVLAVGYRSAAALQSIRADLPESVTRCLPPEDAFRAAVDKSQTLSFGNRIDIDTPSEHSDVVADLDEDGRAVGALEALPFPLFLKARYENGQQASALVESPGEFWETYDRIAGSATDGEVLVQEYIDGEDATYGCGVLFVDGDIRHLFGHEEIRSVPRNGGSGTHLRIHRDPRLETASIRLLRSIGWNGIALVEYKKRPDGTFVLMEINPKFWASYPLASTYGYRFASTMVASVLDLEIDPHLDSPRQHGEMVFPLRELNYYVRNRESEKLTECIASMAKPGRAWDVDRDDLWAHLTPPKDLIQKASTTYVPDRFVSPH